MGVVANAVPLVTCPLEQDVATTRCDGGLTFVKKAIIADPHVLLLEQNILGGTSSQGAQFRS